jgi:hypothetical protein
VARQESGQSPCNALGIHHLQRVSRMVDHTRLRLGQPVQHGVVGLSDGGCALASCEGEDGLCDPTHVIWTLYSSSAPLTFARSPYPGAW